MDRRRSLTARRILRIVGAVAATVALGACGSSSKSTSTGTTSSGFAASADGICSQAAAANVAATRTHVTNKAAATRQVDALVAARGSALVRLRALTPPAQDQAAYRHFLARWPQVEAMWRRGVTEITKGAAAYNGGGPASAALESAETAAAKAGLTACAGKLPPADVSALTALIREGQLRPRASLCTESTSTRFIAVSGGMQACLQSTKTRSTAVRISNLRGTSPIASAMVSRTGGNQPSGTFTFWFVKLGGRWQLDDAY